MTVESQKFTFEHGAFGRKRLFLHIQLLEYLVPTLSTLPRLPPRLGKCRWCVRRETHIATLGLSGLCDYQGDVARSAFCVKRSAMASSSPIVRGHSYSILNCFVLRSKNLDLKLDELDGLTTQRYIMMTREGYNMYGEENS
jgi:hypothetical protein